MLTNGSVHNGMQLKTPSTNCTQPSMKFHVFVSITHSLAPFYNILQAKVIQWSIHLHISFCKRFWLPSHQLSKKIPSFVIFNDLFLHPWLWIITKVGKMNQKEIYKQKQIPTPLPSLANSSSDGSVFIKVPSFSPSTGVILDSEAQLATEQDKPRDYITIFFCLHIIS